MAAISVRVSLWPRSNRVPEGGVKDSVPYKCEEMDAAYKSPLLSLLHLCQKVD